MRIDPNANPELDPSTVRFDPYRAFGRYQSQPEAGFDIIAVNAYTGAARFPSAGSTRASPGFARPPAAR
ncbi:MAG: hypothetical protein IPF99_01265 [Deltaproteobacteria bacterium]|nr:hypothetical protein [Deltaproteobacteria bacterium]